jgi:mono/diheme cytochrome c family protein
MAIGGGLSSEQRLRYCVSIVLLAGGFVLATVIGFADTAKPAMNVRAKQGAVLFQQHCVTCHNKQPDDASPFGPPNLHGIFSSKPLVQKPVTPLEAKGIIKKGWAPMPPFAGVLSNTQIDALIAYLKTQ